MKQLLLLHDTISAASTESKYSKVIKVFRAVANIWKRWANIDVLVSDDGRGITYPDKSNHPVSQRVEIKMIPEYHLMNNLQDEILVTTDLNELRNTISDVINEDRH